MNSFADILYRRLEVAQFAEYQNNYDELRFGPQKRFTGIDRLKWQGRRLCRHFGWYHRTWLRTAQSTALAEWMPLLPELEWLYRRLADDESRTLLIEIIAYRIMGHLAVQLPLGTQAYRNKRADLMALGDSTDRIDLNFMEWSLTRHNLASIGYPMTLYIRGAMATFFIEQYAQLEADITAEDGDVVLDGGACYGDTALYFAHKVGPRGSVHAFEFIPSSLEIMHRNLDLNPALASRITIAERALWDQSGLTMHVLDRGPASTVSFDDRSDDAFKVHTVSIDQYVEQRGIDRVDFIKLDIEGAEEKALLGSAKTIRTMKPKMAVCLYHSPQDFVRLPRLLDEFCPDYQFFIKHATMHQEETVLFAKV